MMNKLLITGYKTFCLAIIFIVGFLLLPGLSLYLRNQLRGLKHLIRNLILSKIPKSFLIGLFALFIGVQSAFAAIVQIGTAQTAYVTNSARLTVNIPAGVAIGDVLIINVIYGGNGGTAIPLIENYPGGWTIVSSALSGDNTYRGTIFYKVVTNTWEDKYTIALSYSPLVSYGEASIVAFRGVDPTKPIDAMGNFTTTSGVGGSTINPTGITTVSSNALVVMLGMSYRSDNNAQHTFSSWLANSPATFTELYDYGGGNRVSVGAATAIKATPGPTGNGTITLSGNNSYRGGIMLAFKPDLANPMISVVPSSLDFAYVASGGTSGEQTFVISGTNLNPTTGDITVTSPTGFEVSKIPGSGFASSVQVAYSGSALGNTSIYVRFKPTGSPANYSGDISNTGGGATSKNVAVTGNSILTYCTPVSRTSSGYITNVTLNTINNSTGQNTYTDYSGSISTNVTKNSIYDLSVTFQAGGSRRYVYAWIDWNQDGDFVDAGEEFSVGNTNLSTTLTQNITVPVNALVGNTRMRVIIRYNQAPGPCDNDNFYGEIEDYSIIVTAPCIAVGNSAVFGNNLWNVYAYDGSNIDLSGITYKGYYTESDFSFSSTNKWGQDFSPSDATGYNGCTVPNDNHTFVYKRKGFEQGVYQITVGHDDAYRLYIDGDLKSSAANWDNNTPVVLGTNYTLGATTEIEFRIAEVGGGSRGSLNFVVQCTPPEPPVLSALSTSICNGGSTTLGIASGDLKDADHWQWYSGSCGGTIVGQGSSIIVSPTATTTYYVRGEGTCEGTTCGAITITVNAPTTIANQPSDQLVCESGTATFTVAAFNAISYKWQENSGSGFVDITENSIYTGVSLATLTITNPTFSRNGYSYRCKVNGICPEVSTSNSAKLNVTATPTVAVAGDDQSICGTSVTLSANTPTAGTGSWSIQSGTGGSFGNASSPTSTFTGTTGAIYTLRWTISNTPCTASTSDVVIEFLSVPATAGTIIGNSPICAGNSGVNYAVPDIAEATSYIWAYSGTGATLNGTGNSITIDFASDVTAGNLTVKGVNDCGAGAVSANYPITVSPSPVTTVGATICAGAAGSVMTVTSNCPDLTNRNTGAKNAGTGANVAIGSNVNWSNPGNITAVGTPYATANNLGAGANSDYLVATGYNFNIPANATITGIGVSINRYGPQNFTIGCRDNSLYLVKNNVIQTSGTNKASGTQWPNSFQSASYTSDLWNLTWNVSDINNSNFGVALSVHSNRYLTVMAPQVDYMQITVSYTVPGSITWYTQSSGGTVVETGTILNPIGDPEVIAQGGIFGNLGNTNTPDTYTFFAECSSTPGCRAATDFVINACCTNPTNGGTIAVAQTICYGGDPVAFTSTGLPTGHTGTLEYKWQLSTTSNGSGFSDIPSATGLTYDVPNNLTQTTWYRRLARVSCTGWTAVASNVLEITVRNNLTAGTVGTAQTICYNTAPAGLTQTAAAAGGTGTFTYQWQNSADNVTFANITGATLATYNPGTLTTTTYYRRNVTSGTCGTVSSASVKITVNANLTAAISGGTTPVCYNTAPGTFTATGAGATGTYTYLWYKGGVSTGATTQTYTPVSLTTTTAFYCAVTSGTCGTVNTATTTITVNADLTAGTVGTAQMICYNAIPAGLTQTAAAIGGTGAFTYQWQNSADNVTFANITGATLATYTPGTLTATTYYRRKVTSGTCGTVSSASVKITVNANLTAAISGGTSTICYNTAPGTFTATGTGGTGAYTYLWYKGGVSTGITTQTYDPGNLTATTNFYCAITSGTCGTVNTATTTISVNDDLTAGTVGTAQTICYNTAPAGLTQTAAAAGGTGTFTYQWQSSPDNSAWTDVSLATGLMYAPAALTATTYYRRNVTSGSCGTVSSASVKITVNANLTAAISGGTTPVCYNTAPGAFTATGAGGTGAYTYLWYKGGVSTGITTQTYDPGNLTATTNFYCAITSGTCGTLNTATTTITVNADLTAGTIGAAQTICYNTAPAGLTQTAAATGGTGTFTYQWQSSPDNSVWTDIATATGSTYAPIELTSSTYYRRNVTSGTCGTVSSASVKITVNANLTAAISGGTSTICYNTAPGTFTATGTGGTGAYTYLWYKGGVSTGITTQTYAPGNITATTDFYCAITSGSCGTMNTALTTITVNTVLSVTATTTNNTCIGGKTGSITTSAIGGLAPYQYKLNSGTYTGTNTFSNQAIGSYTVWVKDDLGCEISTSVTVDEIAAPTDDQSSANLNSWKGHVYDATNFGRYAGYITQSEDFSTNFGANGDAYCISLLSNGSSWGSILNQTFSVRFRMNSDKTGCYLVNLQSDDGIRLTVDGKIVLSDWTNHSPKWANHVLVPLNGSSQLTLEYYENTGENQVAYTNIRKIQNELTVNTSQPICEGGTFSAISGTLDLGSGVPLPTGITATYKWSYLKSPSAVWIDIAAETGASYTPTSSIFNSVGTFQIKRTAIIASTNNLGASSAVTGITESNEATIIISATPYAIIAYPGSPYCFNAGAVSVVQTGTLGGSYSADPSGLTISSATGEVDVNTSIPGDYTITYTVAAAGGCGNFTTTATMSINGDRIWTGTESTDWNTQGNWLCGAVPDLTTNVHIPNVTNKPIINLGNTGSAKDITIAAASSVTVTGTLQIAGAIINNGTFTASSGTIEMIGSMDQDIGINGDGVFAGNTIKNLIVNKNAASVTLKAPLNVTEIVKVVKVNGDLISNGFLTLISTAEKTALIDGSGSGDVKGNVTMQRYLPKAFGYKYFSSPFKEATVAQFKDLVDLRPFVTPLPVFPIPAVPIFPNFYKYDENHLSAALSDMSGWTVYTDLAGVLHPREGYAANFGSVVRSETVYMTGEVNNGTFLTPLTLYNHNRLYTKGFNLVGNPYPSPIDWEKVNLTDSNIDNALYFFNAGNTDQYTGVYTSYINDISTAIIAGEVQEDANTFNNIIAAMQGFFVHVADPAGTNSTTATLSITNAARITDLYPIFKSALIDSRTILRFSANFETKNAIADAAVVYFDDQANRSFDKDKDALKMLNTDLLVPNLYTISTDPKQLSINGMPFPADSITRIPLGITTLSDGWINFSAKEISQLPSDLHLYLIDAVGGITQDLKQNPEYRFYLKTGEYNQRFTLVFSLSAIADPTTFTEKMFTIARSSNLLIVKMNLPFNTKGSLMVTNMLGQLILRQEVFENETVEINPKISSGVFVVTVISGKRKESEKILMRKDYE